MNQSLNPPLCPCAISLHALLYVSLRPCPQVPLRPCQKSLYPLCPSPLHPCLQVYLRPCQKSLDPPTLARYTPAPSPSAPLPQIPLLLAKPCPQLTLRFFPHPSTLTQHLKSSLPPCPSLSSPDFRSLYATAHRTSTYLHWNTYRYVLYTYTYSTRCHQPLYTGPCPSRSPYTPAPVLIQLCLRPDGNFPLTNGRSAQKLSTIGSAAQEICHSIEKYQEIPSYYLTSVRPPPRSPFSPLPLPPPSPPSPTVSSLINKTIYNSGTNMNYTSHLWINIID
jgi:hypothetical protein